MPKKSAVTASQRRAYRKTSYVVLPGRSEVAFVIRFGRPHPKLDAFLRMIPSKPKRWAFITAFNRQSRTDITPAENEAAQKALRVELRRRKLKALAAIGLGDAGTWMGEPSFLVLGVDLAQASELGRMFEQNAIVVGELGGKPKLILLR